MIIGFTGRLSAGKGELSEMLKQRGFHYFSLSNEVREVARERGIEITRENLQKLGNSLREEEGVDVLAKLVVKKIIKNNYSNSIIDGIRNPGEVNYLRQNIRGFSLISLDAPKEERFRRMVERNRESDPKTWEEFLKVDDKDYGIGESESGQGVGKCMALADYHLYNDSNLDELKKKFEEIYFFLLNSKMRVKIKKLHTDAKIPSYAKDGDAGMDVHAISKEDNGKFIEYGTGLALEVPKGYVCLIFSRSGVSNKKLSLANSVGVLDSGYRGELKLRFYKHGDEEYDIGDKIGQIMIVPYPLVEFEEVSELSESSRGDGGFGSTGK